MSGAEEQVKSAQHMGQKGIKREDIPGENIPGRDNWNWDLTRIGINDGRDFLIYRCAGGRTVEVVDIAVNTSRRKGTGSHLINILINMIVPPYNIYAFTRRSNIGAGLFYQSLDFKGLCILPDFYLDDGSREDAIIYARSIA